ncbi:helix-turn-helix domain-containing protein [Nonomuraea sediminis]|nr:helix-turn-helix domain-containing protein [Nonomuraea sediminis]
MPPQHDSFIHHSSSQHRFARFHAITGRDVRRPADAAVVALALRADGL